MMNLDQMPENETEKHFSIPRSCGGLVAMADCSSGQCGTSNRTTEDMRASQAIWPFRSPS